VTAVTTTNDGPPADHEKYSDLLGRVFPLYQDQRYADALAHVRTAAGDLPTLRSDTAHLAACLLALDGRPDEALVELRAAYDDGGWWARPLLEDDDDLAALKRLDGFGELVDASDDRCRASQEAAQEMVVIGAVDEARAVLVALHGANGDGPRAAAIWQPLASHGVLLAAPTSSRRTTPTHRTWSDGESEWRDITQVAALLAHPSGPLIVGGMSAGGRQALQWIISPRVLTASGELVPSAELAPSAFLVVCPAIGVARLDLAAIPAAAARGVRGHAVLGAEDGGTESALEALELLRVEGIDVSIDVVEGLGHDYPVDFVERVAPVLTKLVASAAV
jgi:hypothetical protein